MNIDMASFLGEIILEYEENFGPLHFSVEKMNGEFAFTEMDERLLDLSKLSLLHIGKPLAEFDYLNEKSLQFYINVFNRAWGGKTVVYYMIPRLNLDIYLIVLIKPVVDDQGEILFIKGRSACNFTSRLSIL
ncbi:hypothetical protein [Metabacillus sp. FJAT-52054]|uniref:Uncharacterized protein n=1 Tax=Metabacillus sediminis TaxID=3117746 RepID=A0ABZ2NK91_9BACI